MNWHKAFISIGYSLGQISMGLLLHPYQTMQSLVQDKVFVWMTLLPTGALAVTTIGWKYAIVPLVQQTFSCASTHFIGCQYLSFASNLITFFCIYWQIILLYLLFRFSRAFDR